jgi:polyhydroxyalkanoate synthase subunit PhaC
MSPPASAAPSSRRAANPGSGLVPASRLGQVTPPEILTGSRDRQSPRRDLERDSYAATAFGEVLDRSLHATQARFTGGLSPAALMSAYWDWATHLASSPGKQFQLMEKAVRKLTRFSGHAAQCTLQGGHGDACIKPLPQDRRFEAAAWQIFPFSLIYQSFLFHQQWWHNATTGIRGVTKQHERVLSFATRQMLDMLSPSNFLMTNPVALQRTFETGGLNLVQGARNLTEDWERTVSGKKPYGAERFEVGRNLAVTPGKVIYRNRLIELIQYAPATAEVRPEPILIVPAWIMKYYILDLSPANSLVKYLTEQGFTVFMISWKNPGPGDRDLGMDDYYRLGVMAALDAVTAVIPDTPVHAVGYCIGGTLLALVAAALGRDGDKRLKTVTLLAAQTDFHEAGELMLFINESQLSLLEDLMWEQGFLDTSQMAGAFQMIRSNDLVWSRMVQQYLMGEREEMFDMMAWNADATRMPYRMHSEYLRHLFLDNDLAEGRCVVGEKAVALADIRAPIFAVGTIRDHVAPWRSVYKIHLLTDTEITFALTAGGHNMGIVSEPGRNGRSFQVMAKRANEPFSDPDTWETQAPHKQGSWWSDWSAWLQDRSGALRTPPGLGAPSAGYGAICDAPGTYVLQT